jgi:hypothetical protein
MVNPPAKNIRQMWLQLQVVQAYARVEPGRSFEILNPMVEQLNELIAAAILLGSFVGEEEMVKHEELLMTILNRIVGGSQAQFAAELGTLARADFDGLKSAAEKFQRHEIRLLARLMVAQGVLAEPPAPPDPCKPRDHSDGLALP